MLKSLLSRFKEPSSWAGLAAVAVVFGVPAPVADAALTVANAVAGVAGQPHDVGVVLAAICSAAAFFLPEKKAPTGAQA